VTTSNASLVAETVSRPNDTRWSLSAVAVAVLAVGALVLAYFSKSNVVHSSLWTASALVIACWALAAVAVLSRTPRVGWLVALGALCAAAATAASRMGDSDGHGIHGPSRVIVAIAAPLAMAVSVHVLLSLPDGLLGMRPRRATALVWYVAALTIGIYVACTARLVSPWLAAIGWLVAIASTLPAIYSRYVHASAAGRQRVQCLTGAAVLAAIVVVATSTLHLVVAWPAHLAVTLIAVTALLPLGLVLGTRSFASHADRVLVQLLTMLGMTVVVAVAYLIAIRGFGKVPTTSASREVLWWSMTAALGAAIVYLTLRNRFVRLSTGFTYGAREAPDEVVRTFGSRLTRAIPMDELLLQLVESLRKTLTLASAEIYTGSGEILDLIVSVPDMGKRSLRVSGDERSVVARAGVSGNAWASVWIPSFFNDRTVGPMRVAPISHGGELLGIIVVTRVEGAVAFREEDDRVLTELARQVGLALHNAQLDTALQSSLDELRRQADELRASRARVVASGDAERRRVERNLHDGAQQHLVALAVNLRLVKDVVTDDPDAAVEMLDELGQAVQETIRELRELAHGIYPPLLVDSGLSEALRAVANRSPLDIELTTEGIGRYGGDVEAAVYFCCLEALQNAGKHATQAHVCVRIWEESGGLLFEVSDDGPGFDIRMAKRGHGYVNMMDRLGAIGGAVRWESQIGEGTTIRGSLPLN